MNQKPPGRASSSEQIIRDIKRKTHKQYGAEEKSRIVLDGLRAALGRQLVRFYDTDRAVVTASSEQVRQPNYARSVNS